MEVYVCELAPGKQTAPQQHMFEEVVYVLDGNGALDGLRGHGTFETSGIFNTTISGTNEMRLHDHR